MRKAVLEEHVTNRAVFEVLGQEVIEALTSLNTQAQGEQRAANQTRVLEAVNNLQEALAQSRGDKQSVRS